MCGYQCMWEKASLPLTAVYRASGLALCVNAFASRAHLQLSASGGGRAQSIGRAIGGRGGSGHGWARIRLWTVGEEAACGGKKELLDVGESSASHSMRRGRCDDECWYCHRRGPRPELQRI